MSIRAGQTELRTIVERLLPHGRLDRTEAIAMLEVVQHAAGVDDEDIAAEHSMIQSIAQRVSALTGLRAGDVRPSLASGEPRARVEWLQRLAAQLRSREARELTFAFVFLTVVADLQLTPTERDTLDDVQSALGIDDDRATDLVVFLTECVASAKPA